MNKVGRKPKYNDLAEAIREASAASVGIGLITHGKDPFEMGAKSLDDVEKAKEKIREGSVISCWKPIANSGGGVTFMLRDAVVISKFNHHMLVEELDGSKYGHKRRWCVTYTDLVSDAMYKREKFDRGGGIIETCELMN